MRRTQRRTSGDAALRYHRIVAKFGTNVLTGGSDRLSTEVMTSLVGQVVALHDRGAEVIVVTSGAIAAGRYRLGRRQERKDMPFRQVLAAIGQSDLMQAYQELFGRHGITVAQTLLTRRDLADRQGYLNARNTLLAMLELRVVPVVNENDVVAVDEIEGAKIGDNDNLSALVANLVDADLLVLLTDTGGLYSADPRLNPNAELIARIERIDKRIEALAGDSLEGPGVGGMTTKLQAARLAMGGGADTIIAAGNEPDVLVRLASGEAIGTLFPAAVSRMESRKRWMLAGLSVKGSIVVDSGAAKVLREDRRSLLPAGVQDVRGKFLRGEAVAVIDGEGRRIACGIANYGSDEIMRIKGLRSDRIEETLGHHYGGEVVHRDNLALL
ncbi:MAG TPA: glutamate 5-kinase [Dehalococcoidia bacterium]|jgi:glutamate 5-kinase|nr:glutamate 5-kinase [Dehalococcoidia bacterium]